MGKTITKTIKVDDISKSCDFITAASYPNYRVYPTSIASGYYRIQINNPRKDATLEKDIDKNIMNIRIVYEIEQEILDEGEKEYLRNVIKPFRNKILKISKQSAIDGDLYIDIEMEEEDFNLPYFRDKRMYRGMEVGKEYTLEELGL